MDEDVERIDTAIMTVYDEGDEALGVFCKVKCLCESCTATNAVMFMLGVIDFVEDNDLDFDEILKEARDNLTKLRRSTAN